MHIYFKMPSNIVKLYNEELVTLPPVPCGSYLRTNILASLQFFLNLLFINKVLLLYYFLCFLFDIRFSGRLALFF